MALYKDMFLRYHLCMHPSFGSSVDENVHRAVRRLTSFPIFSGIREQQLAHSSFKQFTQKHFSSFCFPECANSAPVIYCKRRENFFHCRIQVFKILVHCDVLEMVMHREEAE